MEKLQIIKIGGQVIESESILESFLKDLAGIQDKMIVVHGGGKLTTQLAQKLGVEQQLVDGRRITDAETLKIATMVYAGLINKQLVVRLQSLGKDALGLSGTDLNCIQTVLRKKGDTDYGFAGDLFAKSINTSKFQTLLEMGCTPVVCSITHDGKGQLLNTNADTLASGLAVALSPFYEIQLNYCFEKSGVMLNPEDDTTVFDNLSVLEYKGLKEKGIIHSGMIPKLDNAFDALSMGVSGIIIGHSGKIKQMIAKKDHHGTELKSA